MLCNLARRLRRLFAPFNAEELAALDNHIANELRRLRLGESRRDACR